MKQLYEIKNNATSLTLGIFHSHQGYLAVTPTKSSTRATLSSAVKWFEKNTRVQLVKVTTEDGMNEQQVNELTEISDKIHETLARLGYWANESDSPGRLILTEALEAHGKLDAFIRGQEPGKSKQIFQFQGAPQDGIFLLHNGCHIAYTAHRASPEYETLNQAIQWVTDRTGFMLVPVPDTQTEA